MKKQINHQGKYKATIVVSPQFSINCELWRKPLSEEIADRRSFQVTVNVNDSQWATILDIKSNELLGQLNNIEQSVIAYMVQTSEGQTIESQLSELGYV